MSEITIRKDLLSNSVSMTNALLRQKLQKEIDDEEISIICHKNIKSYDQMYDNKHLNKDRKGNNLSGVEELALDFYNSIDGSGNGTEIMNSIRKKQFQNYRNFQPKHYRNSSRHMQQNNFGVNKTKPVYQKKENNGHYNTNEYEIQHVPTYFRRLQKDTRYVNYFIPSEGCLGTLV